MLTATPRYKSYYIHYYVHNVLLIDIKNSKISDTLFQFLHFNVILIFCLHFCIEYNIYSLDLRKVSTLLRIA